MRMPHKCGLGARVKLADGREGKVVSLSTFNNKTGGWQMEVLPDGIDDHMGENRIKTYDDEVEILDTGSPTNGAIVHWAPYGDHIPLTCQKCGAHFHTKNIAEGRSLFQGYHGEGFDFVQEYLKAKECDEADHSYNDLEPNRELYELRYPPKVAQ